MYAMVCTHPDISHPIRFVSRFLANPGKAQYEAVKWIFRYLRGTSKVRLSFGESEPSLEGYTDSDMVGQYLQLSALGPRGPHCFIMRILH